MLDLAAAGASEERLAKAIDSAVRLRKSAVLVLTDRLAELRGSGHRGVRRLDFLLVDSGGESVLERKFLTLVREAGLPRPKTQAAGLGRQHATRAARAPTVRRLRLSHPNGPRWFHWDDTGGVCHG